MAYTEDCLVCNMPFNTSNDRLSILPTGAYLFLPNADCLNQERRASAYPFCTDCLDKLMTLMGKEYMVEYSTTDERYTCKSLLKIPHFPTVDSVGEVMYLGLAAALIRQYNKDMIPLDKTDFRRMLQVKLTGDWTGIGMYDFVSLHARSWLNVDFHLLTDVLWELYQKTWVKPLDYVNVKVKYRIQERLFPSYDSIKREKTIRDEFCVIVSTEPYTAKTKLAERVRTINHDFPFMVETFDLDLKDAKKFFNSVHRNDGLASADNTYLWNTGTGAPIINGLRVEASIHSMFDGNIGCQRIRSNGSRIYET